MTTPIILTILLVGPLVLGRVLKAATGDRWWSVATLAAIGLSLVFLFSGTGHFVMTQGMVAMLPEWFPKRELAVHFSGVFEWGLAIALLVPRTRKTAAWMAAAFLVAVFPVNIWAAINHAGLGGHQWGPAYLWIRLPLQLLFIGWAVLAGRSVPAT